MTAQTAAAETIVAYKLRPGHRVLVYGGPVMILEATREPAHEPAKTVAIRFRCDFANGTFLIARRTVPATQAFEVYDDGEAF